MILPFPLLIEHDHGARLTPAEVASLKAFIHGQPDRFRAPFRLSSAELCVRDGHRPVARWRGVALRCFRCQRCGQEKQP